MPNPSNALLALLVELSQRKSREKIQSSFVEASNSLFSPHKLRWLDDGETSKGEILRIATAKKSFGNIAIEPPLSTNSKETASLLHHATNMLAVILEKCETDKLLVSEKSLLQNQLDEKRLQLQESEKLLIEMAQNYPNSYISIIEKDLSVGFSAGQEFKKQGLNPSDFIGLSLEEVFGEHTKEVKERYLKTFKGEEQEFQLFINEQYQRYRTVPLTDQNGNINRIMSVVENITEHVLAQQASKKNEARFETLTSTSPAGIYETDPHGKCIYVNEQWLKMTGLSIEEAQGDGWIKGIHPDDRDLIRKKWKKMIQSKDNWALEYRFQDKQGKTTWVSGTARALLDSKNNITGYVGVNTDITERKEAEDALRESENRFNLAMLATQDGLYDWNLVTNEIYYSPGWKRMLGYEDHEIPNDFSEWERLTNPEDVKKSWKMLNEHIEGKRDRFEVEFKMRHKDGHCVDILSRANAVFDKKGKAIRVVGTHVDISEIKKAESALRESENRYRNLFENAAFGIILCRIIRDEDGNVTDFEHLQANSATEKHTGFPLETFFHKRASEMVSPETVEQLTKQYNHVVETGEATYYEQYFSIYDKTLQVGASHISSDLFTLTFVDISDQKQAEQSLRESGELLRSAFDAAANVGFITTDISGEDTQILNCSPGAENIFGYSKDELIGQKVAILHPPGIAEEFPAMQKALEDNKKGQTVEATLVRKSGECFPALFTIHPIFDSESKLCGTVGVTIDISEQKQAEEALKEREEKYRLLADNTLDVIWTMNMELVFTYVNPSIEQLTGHTAEEWIGSNLMSHADETNFAKMAEIIGIELAKGPGASDIIFEAELLKKNNELVPVEIHGTVMYDEKGEPIGLQGVTRNITQRIKSEVQLTKMTEFLVDAQAVAKIGSWEYDVATDRPTWSKEMYRIFGLDPTEGEPPWEEHKKVIHPDNWDKLDQAVQACITEGHPYSEEYRILRPDGSVHWGHSLGRAIRDEDGNVVRLIGTAQEVTDRKLAEQALRESEENHRAYITNAPDGIFVVNAKGEYIEVNEAACQMMGYSKEELLNMSIPDLISPNIPPESKGSFARLKKTGEIRHETILRKKDGTDIFISLKGVALSEDRFMAFCSDITEIKRAEEERKLLEAQLHQSQKMESIGRLAGGVAHDFNNLLTAIQGFSDIVHDSLNENDPIRKDVGEIQKAADSAAQLTQQLLAFSRKQIISPKVISLNKAIQKSEKMLRRIIGEDIDFVFNPADDSSEVLIDPGQIDQILVNLSVNSRDAMPLGGKLTVETQITTIQKQQCIACNDSFSGEFVVLKIGDTGQGIDSGTLENIFEPFFTTKDQGKGTGLGLSTIHGIVHQNHGHVSVQSELGTGTTFSIFLPHAEKVSDQIIPPKKTDQVQGNETVLVVEDLNIVRKLAVRTLKLQGYNVIEAQNGGEALLALEKLEGKIDLLLTDVVMPQMSGKELFDRFQKIYPHIKALFMSGYTDDEIAHHGVLDKGINFINKPFRPQELVLKTREVLDND